MDFLSYLQSKGITPHPGLADDLGSEEHTAQRIAQAIVSAGVCTAEEMDDHLLMYKMESILDESVVDVTAPDNASALLDEYLLIVEDCFLQLYKLRIEHGDFHRVTEVENDYIILQQVMGDESNSFAAGLAVRESAFLDIAKGLYDQLGSGIGNAIPEFGGTIQDAADLFCEAVNNINGFCTYRFSADYDLKLAECKKKALISAPEIYAAQVAFSGFTLDLVIIMGTDYSFSKAVE